MKRYFKLFFVVIWVIMLKNINAQNRTNEFNGWFLTENKYNTFEIGRADELYNNDSVYYLKSISIGDSLVGVISNIEPVEQYLGKRVRMSGYIKTENIDGFSGMLMGVDGHGMNKPIAYDNMINRPIIGTTDWNKYEIVLDVPSNTVKISYGFLLYGTGKAWISKVSFEPVGLDVKSTNLMK